LDVQARSADTPLRQFFFDGNQTLASYRMDQRKKYGTFLPLVGYLEICHAFALVRCYEYNCRGMATKTRDWEKNMHRRPPMRYAKEKL
jgi:hypothetical protein